MQDLRVSASEVDGFVDRAGVRLQPDDDREATGASVGDLDLDAITLALIGGKDLRVTERVFREVNFLEQLAGQFVGCFTYLR